MTRCSFSFFLSWEFSITKENKNVELSCFQRLFKFYPYGYGKWVICVTRKQCYDANMWILWFAFPMSSNELLSNYSMSSMHTICQWVSFILIPVLHGLSQEILSHAELDFQRVKNNQGTWGTDHVSASKIHIKQKLV